MKKRLLAVLLAAVCLCSLTACGGGASADPEGYTLGTLKLLTDGGAFSEELETLDTETAFMLYRFSDYDLESDALNGCSVLRSSGATCEEAAFLLWQTEEQAIQAKEALMDYIQGQIDANVDYRPAEIPKLEDAVISQIGRTVLMLVANDMAAAEEAVPALTAF